MAFNEQAQPAFADLQPDDFDNSYEADRELAEQLEFTKQQIKLNKDTK
ncbi:MAG TPA: hypothetical protein VHG71_11525 [Verrucomicrobiae bacterium]|nr:hypothetical protein [Verrucomicrobiae bacterium]